ncbi:hypothetical protein [Streptomyces hiroshimensis]|uniref:Uncharacterized protein n=1 Tax=Streptomyces hiroshimensis TaxID=66424 RepID=A0ABQ2Y372_9ACTN|nr:hypothetical protein [Streptomyces hiroshimensis]GGX60997.1 hypothetical protein GCM10010324_02010 [Streptomyces hiroshimensis]
MRNLARAALVVLCATGAALPVLPVAQAATSAAPLDCRYVYSNGRPGPGGETRGSGVYDEGDRDSEGRVCHNGWWVHPYEVHHRDDDHRGDDHGRNDDHRRDDDHRWDNDHRRDDDHRWDNDHHRDDHGRNDDDRRDHDRDHDHSHGRRP